MQPAGFKSLPELPHATSTFQPPSNPIAPSSRFVNVTRFRHEASADRFLGRRVLAMKIPTLSALAVLALLSVTPVFAGLGRPTAQNVGGVPTLSGGIGEDERRLLDAVDDKFNLKLVFALDRSAAPTPGAPAPLLSDVDVT